MLLQSSIGLPPQPIERAEPVRLRRDSSEQSPEFTRVLGNARGTSIPEQAAVVHFGSRALGLARSQPPPADVSLAEERDASAGPAASDATAAAGARDTAARPVGRADVDAVLDAFTASTLAAAAPGTAAPGATAASAPATGPGESAAASESEEPTEEDQAALDQLKRRDREVRTHEQAHKAAGGAHAGSMRLSYQMGPDGKRYAVEGSVPIDVSPVAGDPAATLRKMEVVSRAANAPASPSGADRAVAAQAARMAQQARAQIAAERYARARELVPGA
jgi:SprA family protein